MTKLVWEWGVGGGVSDCIPFVGNKRETLTTQNLMFPLCGRFCDVMDCLTLESFPETIKLYYFSLWCLCKAITHMEHSQTAGPVHGVCYSAL